MSDQNAAFNEAFAKLGEFANADLAQLEAEARTDPEAFQQFARMVVCVERYMAGVSETWNRAATQFNALAERLGRPNRVH